MGRTITSAVFLMLAACVCLSMAHYHSLPDGRKIITGVRLSGGRIKRQNDREPIRIVPIYDSSVTSNPALPPEKVNMLMTETVPKLIEFFQNSLSVDPVQGPLLFDHECTDGLFFPTTNLGERGCALTCAASTTCGQVSIPQAHLKQCIQCNNVNSAQSCERVGDAQPGVSNADVVLYISAVDTLCPPAGSAGSVQRVAFATACQMEASTDRPIAGNVNFCPLGVVGNDPEFILAVVKHEAAHALGFASFLYAFWRDESGNPRTRRDPTTNLPTERSPEGFFMPSTDTVRFDVEYNDWRTINGMISHTVIHMVTPAVLREARAHFECTTLEGVELENQGGRGTAVDHWEKRILGNEAMTGVLTFNPVFSRLSLAVFEDSGWYSVNYSMAQDLAWGKGAGCRFPVSSCLEWIKTRTDQNLPVTPFCTVSGELGCTSDSQAVSKCNIGVANPPVDYQYFTTRTQGGGIEIADFCPFEIDFQIIQTDDSRRGTDCEVSGNQPSTNIFAETYGPDSRCFQHGSKTWASSISGFIVSAAGSGCYQYNCSPTTGVTVTIAGNSYQCSCEGEELQFAFSEGGNSFSGSVTCPACSQICYDDLTSCPVTEPAACYGRVTVIPGTTDQPVVPVPTANPSNPGGGGNGAGQTSVVAMVTVALAVGVLTLI